LTAWEITSEDVELVLEADDVEVPDEWYLPSLDEPHHPVMLSRFIAKLEKLVVRTLQLVAGVGVLVCSLTAWNWTSIKNFAFRESLVSQANTIRQASCPIDKKELLLDRLDDVMDYLLAGETVGLVRFWEFHNAVEPLLKDGITSDERRLVEREIDRLERDLRRAAINWTERVKQLQEREP